MLGSADVFTSSRQQKPQLVIKNEDKKPVISEEKPVKSASVSSHHDTQPEDDGTADILLSEIMASRRREGKAIVPDKKLQKAEQTSVEEGLSRPVMFHRGCNWSSRPQQERALGSTKDCKYGGERVLLLLSEGSEVPDRDEDEPCDRVRLLEGDREGQGDL